MKNEGSKWSTSVDHGLPNHDGDIVKEGEYDMCFIMINLC